MSSESELNQHNNDFGNNYPWIHNIFFENILRENHPDQDVVVQSYVLKPALAKGENYGSQMIRATVTYTVDSDTRKIDLIIKAAIKGNGMSDEMLEGMKGVFIFEITIYEQVLKKAQELLRAVGDIIKLHGRCYCHSTKDTYLVFEDLTSVGFKNVNRRFGLDVAHLKLVMSTVAKFHAASAIILQQNPSLKETFKKSIIELGEEVLSKMILSFYKAKEKFCRIQGLEKLADKLAKVQNTIYDRIRAATVRNENDFNLLLHGDLWSNNIMFKYDENGLVTDTVLVDFQTNYYGSPALDITYALYTSSNANVTPLDWEMLIQHYYYELKSTLKKLNYSEKIPSLMEFQAQAIFKGLYGASMGIFGSAVKLSEDSQVQNLEDKGLLGFMNDTDEATEYRVKLLLHPEATKVTIKLLQYFDQRGYFDVD